MQFPTQDNYLDFLLNKLRFNYIWKIAEKKGLIPDDWAKDLTQDQVLEFHKHLKDTIKITPYYRTKANKEVKQMKLFFESMSEKLQEPIKEIRKVRNYLGYNKRYGINRSFDLPAFHHALDNILLSTERILEFYSNPNTWIDGNYAMGKMISGMTDLFWILGYSCDVKTEMQ